MRPLLQWLADTWPTTYHRVVSRSRQTLTQWRLQTEDSILQGRLGRLSRWIKGQAQLPVLEVGGELVCHPQHIGEQLRRHWGEVYCPEQCTPMTDAEIDFMTQYLPRHEWNPEEITLEQLKTTALHRKATAAGLDKVSLKMFQSLPDSGWQILVVLLNRIAEGQPWPAPLCRVAMTAIPKSGTKNVVGPLKMRLIAVIPQLYRLWASARAQDANTSWLPHIINRFTYGGVKRRSAKSASAADSLLWDLAKARGVPLKAVYLDCSRCFDTLKFQDLLRVASKLGLGERICLGLQNYYDNHERYVLVRNWVQPSLRPKRGIPQGCPLSVLMSILWGLTWNSRVDRMLSEGPVQISGCATYLDDYSLVMQDEETLQKCLGWTTQHFRLWQVDLNMEKSSLLTSPSGARETINGSPTDLSVGEQSYKLLGISTGWLTASECLKERAEKAAQTVDRIYLLRLSQALFRRLRTFFVVPLLYGSEYHVKLEHCDLIDKKMWQGMWGRARVSTNRAAALSLCLPSHSCTVQGRRWLDIARGIWALANDEHRRALTMELWASPQLPRQGGLWSSFLHMLSKFHLKLAPDGGVAEQDSGKVIMHVAQARQAWLHQARHAWRLHHLRRAADAHNALYPVRGVHMDWSSTLQASCRSPALDTVQSNALNSKSRASRHFLVNCTPLCEHGCNEHDVFAHRLLRCPAGQALRREKGIDMEAIELLNNEQVCYAETLVWRHPPSTRCYIFDIHAAWGLWPCREWLDDILRHLRPNLHPLVVRFEYLHCKWGDHEQLQRHAASVRLPAHEGIRCLQAYGLTSTCRRLHWEAEALLLASIIWQLTKTKVTLKGCAHPAQQLWKLIDNNEIANAHLHQFALLAKEAIDVHVHLPDDPVVSEPSSLELAKNEHFAISLDAILAWQKSYQVSQKAASFCGDSPPLHPLASTISFSHGACARGGTSSGWKGSPSGASCGTFGGGEPFLLLTLESLCSLVPTSLSSEDPFEPVLKDNLKSVVAKSPCVCALWCSQRPLEPRAA